jgi:type II secretory pathway pseudopilin PulG
VPEPDPPKPWWKNLFEFSSLSPGYRAAFAGALALLLLLSVAIFFVWKQSRDESRRLAAEQQQREERRRTEEQTPGNEKPGGTPEQAKEEKEEQLQPPKEYQQKRDNPRQPVMGSALPYFLNPTSGTRGGGSALRTIELRKGVSGFALYLNVSSGDYSRFNARLENVNQNEISHFNSLSPVVRRGSRYIRYPIPTNELTPGIYNVNVDGITESGTVEDFADYLFCVVAR